MSTSRRGSAVPAVHYECKNLFRPLRIGRFTMKNRFVVPNLTRLRADDEHVPTDMMVQHYSDRAGFGLIVSEGTMIQRGYSGFGYEPGIFTQAQVEAWRKVTRAVHVKGGIVFCQLDHAGRATVPCNVEGEIMGPSRHGIFSHKLAGVLTRDGNTQMFPTQVKAMTTEDIGATVERFARAARNAMAAGFDGVEINAGGGHLVDQFLRDSSNTRTDRFGGSNENCARFLLQVVDACIRSIGADRVAVKMTPLESLHDMSDADPEALTRFIAQRLSDRKIAYLHISRGDVLTPQSGAHLWARSAFHGSLITSLGYSVDTAEAELACNGADGVAFGQLSMANAGMVERVLRGQAMESNIALDLVCWRGPEGYIASEPEPLPEAPEDIDAQERERHEEFTVEESMMPRRFSTMDREDGEVPPSAEDDDGEEVPESVHEDAPQEEATAEEAPADAARALPEEEEEEVRKTRLCMPARQLFRPLFIGAHALKNRVAAFAPETAAPGVYALSSDHTDPAEEEEEAAAAAAAAVGSYYVDRASLGALFTPPSAIPADTPLSDAHKKAWQKITARVHAKGGMVIASLQDDGASRTDQVVKAAEDAVEAGFDAVMVCAQREAAGDLAPFLAAVDACAESVGKHLIGACLDASMDEEALRSAADTLGIIGIGFLVVSCTPGDTKEAMLSTAQTCKSVKEVFDEGAVLCEVPYMWIDDAERLIEGGAVDGVCFSRLAELNADLPSKIIRGGAVQIVE